MNYKYSKIKAEIHRDMVKILKINKQKILKTPRKMTHHLEKEHNNMNSWLISRNNGDKRQCLSFKILSIKPSVKNPIFSKAIIQKWSWNKDISKSERIIASRTTWSVSSVQSLSHVQLFETPWIAACQASLSFTISWSLLKLMSIESVMPSSHLILSHPLLLLPPTPPSIRVFSNEPTLCLRWPKYWSFSFSISLSNEHPRLISFRMDWLDLLAVQGTLKSLLQHHSSNASVFRGSVLIRNN